MAMSTDTLHLRTMLMLKWLRDRRESLQGWKPEGPWKQGRILEFDQHISTLEEIERRIRAALTKKQSGGAHDSRATDSSPEPAQSGNGNSGAVPGTQAGHRADDGQVQVPSAEGIEGQDFTLTG